jgi:5-(carboxyamino)imidazole ribonucleotide synthase
MKIGVLGAGQLGRMLALAGYPLDLQFVFLDPATDACAASLGETIQEPYLDEAALARFCASCDVATYEFENVPAHTAEVVGAKLPLYPPAVALTVGQDRLNEKKLFDSLNIPVPRYMPVAARGALDLAIRNIGLPAVMKTRRLGYDGKGQAVLRKNEDLDGAWSRLGGDEPPHTPCLVEAFVPFERELSCLAVRGRDGEMRFYPVVANQHRDGILRVSIPQQDDPLQAQAEDYARRVAEHLNYVGVMAFEFFVSQGQLYANEIAPRVHNSGHWSIEGSECSQFENHLRAVAGLPLGSTAARGYSAMVNFIGRAPDNAALCAIAGVHVHHYGKSPKPQRKVGHATVTASSEAELQSRLAELVALVESVA